MRIVVKVGTSTLAHATGCLNIRHVNDLIRVLSDLKNAGHEIVLVSSGAIGMGVGKLGLPSRPSDLPTKQAAAAVGQCELMYVYDQGFTGYNHNVAQILLTLEDIENPDRHEKFQRTLFRLLEPVSYTHLDVYKRQAHNHTSGVALPSADDISTTRHLKKALDAVGVYLQDHLILAGNDFVSLAASGDLDDTPAFSSIN